MGNTVQSVPVEIDVVGSSSFGVDKKISAARTYNMLISNNALVSNMGYKKVAELLTDSTQRAEGRGIFRSIRGLLFIAVINKQVWKLDNQSGSTFLGEIDTSSGPVFMDENLNGQICIVDGLNAYIYNRNNNALTKQTLGADLTPNYVVFHNTYFLFGNADITGNGAKWFAYSYATDNTITETYELALQTKPDYAKAVVRLPGLGNNVLVMGESVSEIHTNVGGLQGYQRVSTKNIDYGCANVATIAFSDRFVAWLATNQNSQPVIGVFDGQNFTTISTDGINNVLQNINKPNKSSGMMYKIYGHLVYQLTFFDESDDLSIIYDFAEQKFYHVSDYDLTYHPARQLVYANERYYFISLKNGSIYEASTDLTTYDDNIVTSTKSDYLSYRNRAIPRQRICSTIRTGQRFRARRVLLTLKQGDDISNMELANINACGENIVTIADAENIVTIQGEQIVTIGSGSCLIYRPRVDFSFSKDGGESYSAEIGREIRFLGFRPNEMTWERLGMSNEITPKVKFWGMNKFVIVKAVMEVSP